MPSEQGKRKPVDKSKLEYGNHPPKWVGNLDLDRYSEKVIEVLTFFLVKTPCKGTSARGVPLAQYGWKSDTPEKNGYLEKNLFDAANLILNETLFISSGRESEKELFEKAGMGATFFDGCVANRVAYISSGNRLLDLFRTMRNAIAHCRFEVFERNGKSFIAMENGFASASSFETKARLFLSVDDLFDWIWIIENGAEKEKAEKLRCFLELVDLALRAIEMGSISKQDDLRDECGISKSECKRLIGYLKEKGLVEYSRSSRRWIVLPKGN